MLKARAKPRKQKKPLVAKGSDLKKRKEPEDGASPSPLGKQARAAVGAAAMLAVVAIVVNIIHRSGGGGQQPPSTECSAIWLPHSSLAVTGCNASSVGSACEYSCDAGYTAAGPLVCNSDPIATGQASHEFSFTGGGCVPCPDGSYLNTESKSCVQVAECVDEKLAVGTTAHNTVCASWITTAPDEQPVKVRHHCPPCYACPVFLQPPTRFRPTCVQN